MTTTEATADLPDNRKSQTASRISHPLRSVPALLRFAGVAVVGLVLDLWTKSLAWDALRVGGPFQNEAGGRHYVDSNTVRAIPGGLHVQLTVNEGAVFGLGQGNQLFFIAVSVLAVGFLVWLFAHSARQRVYQIILGLLLAGVVGNMYDRLAHGYVRDMIYALPDRQWPGTWRVPLLNYPASPDREVFPWIFNVADVLLCTGVGLMLVYTLFAPRPDHHRDEDAPEVPPPPTTKGPRATEPGANPSAPAAGGA
jgi:lipoprotein signal peptidase